MCLVMPQRTRLIDEGWSPGNSSKSKVSIEVKHLAKNIYEAQLFQIFMEFLLLYSYQPSLPFCLLLNFKHILFSICWHKSMHSVGNGALGLKYCCRSPKVFDRVVQWLKATLKWDYNGQGILLGCELFSVDKMFCIEPERQNWLREDGDVCGFSVTGKDYIFCTCICDL